MSKMGWLHHLVQIAHHDNEMGLKELTEHLGGIGFKNPTRAAEEFIIAYAELEKNAAKVGIVEPNDPDDGSWKGR